jgi:8-oxo-dGTP diphosphatase
MIPQVAVAVVQKNDKFLLVRRTHKEGVLHWQFPSGKIEVQEKGDSACIREVFEETDVVCRVARKFGERIHPDSNVEIHYWLCEYVSGEAIVKEAEEIDQVAWCLPSEVKDLITSNLFQPILEYLNLLAKEQEGY